MLSRRLLLVSGFGLLFSSLIHAQTSTWVPDPAHSGIDFSVLHLGISKVHGHFRLAAGEVQWNDADVTKSKVNITVDVNSVDTGVATRDSDLKTATFFDTSKSPNATFTSTSISKTPGGFSIAGDLTIKGITKPVTLQVEGPTGPVTGMDKKQHVGFSATTTLDRTDFALGTKYPAAIIGKEIHLDIDLDLAKQ